MTTSDSEALLKELLEGLEVDWLEENRATCMVKALETQANQREWEFDINAALDDRGILRAPNMRPELAERMKPIVERLRALRRYLGARYDVLCSIRPRWRRLVRTEGFIAKRWSAIMALADLWRKVENPPYLFGDGLLYDIVREMDAFDQTHGWALNQYFRWLRSGGDEEEGEA